MDLGIRGKASVVVAASRGLGRACAEALAAEGANVAVAARSVNPLRVLADELARHYGVRTLAVAGDVSSAADCSRIIDEAAAAFGRLDILVTNTGGPRPGTFAALNDADFSAAVDSTLMNVVRLIRAAVPHMRRAGGGRIVNITSISVRQPIDGLLLSNTVRPAVIGLAKTLSVELAGDNILINNVCPGIHRTDRMEELADARAAASGRPREEILAEMTAAIPLRRMGEPSEMAALVAFLASARASFITGATFSCDGGAYRGLM